MASRREMVWLRRYLSGFWGHLVNANTIYFGQFL